MTVLTQTYKALKQVFAGLTEGPDNDWVIDINDGAITAATAQGVSHNIMVADCPAVKARAVLRVRNGRGTLRHLSFTDRT